MNFVWLDYHPQTMGYVESWLDESAVRSTGLDEGFRDFYCYWAAEDGCEAGENFWCKVVCEDDRPFAVIVLGLHEHTVTIMELVVAPEKRGQGLGTKLLKELLIRQDITGTPIRRSEAVIYPDNTASQMAFEHAGFHCQQICTDADGTSLRYVYERTSPD